MVILWVLMFAVFYWYSGTDLIHHWGEGRDGKGKKVKDILKDINPFLWEIVKFLTRRKTLMAIGCWVVLLGQVSWWQIGICALAFFIVHFCGWWENKWMSVIRGLAEAIPVLGVLYFRGAGIWSMAAAVGLCLLAFTGVWFLRNWEPRIEYWPKVLKYIDPRWKLAGGLVDWWWVMLGVTGACIGLAINL